MFTPDVNGILITGAETGAAAVAIRDNAQLLGDRARKSKYDAIIDPTTANNASQGYRAGSRWINMTTNQLFECVYSTNITATWVNNTGIAAVTGVATNIGDNSTTYFDVTHYFSTRDVLVQVFRVASPYDEIYPEIQRITEDEVRVIFAIDDPPSTNEFRVLIKRI